MWQGLALWLGMHGQSRLRIDLTGLAYNDGSRLHLNGVQLPTRLQASGDVVIVDVDTYERANEHAPTSAMALAWAEANLSPLDSSGGKWTH